MTSWSRFSILHLEAKSPGVHVPRAMAVMLMQVRHAAARSSVSHHKKCIHGRPFGNVDGFCFYNLEVVQY